jgi:hypothetical protein
MCKTGAFGVSERPQRVLAVALPNDERVMHLRQLARRLEASPQSPQRDELLHRTRLRMVDIEAPPDLDPPSSLPTLSDEPPERWLKPFL